MCTVKVNIVVGNADLHWIAGRFARELVARLPEHGIEAVINSTSPCDLEYQQIVYGEPSQRPAVGLFTHGEFRPRQFAASYDGCICTNSVMAAYLLGGGATSTCVIRPVVDDIYRRDREIVFGVAGRTYSDGRKGEHLVAEMVSAGYTVRAWGSGWPCKIVGTELSQLRDFYRSIDYYIDTSSDEGGCVPAVEAAAMGIPVISHTLGVDRPVIPYELHSWRSLRAVLQALCHPRTYDDFAREHAVYFKAVLERAS